MYTLNLQLIYRLLICFLHIQSLPQNRTSCNHYILLLALYFTSIKLVTFAFPLLLKNICSIFNSISFPPTNINLLLPIYFDHYLIFKYYYLKII